ncbi:MAG: sulfite oxidase [Nitrospira sp.]|nr:sulfite oxidase [Nitrospira sp.]MCP9460712.1 sulfite oxidase [Nitrospira sp.]MCP9476067.1 sulfite oxidase [Nitrospira sp.]
MHRKDLLNEESYDRERADEVVWKRAKVLGLSRRRFIQLLAAGAGAAATANLLPSHRKLVAAEVDRAIIKPAPPELFLQNGSNLEMRWEAMYTRGYLVPNELFFVRNNSPAVPHLDPATWRLQVEGSGVSRPRSFSYDELLTMPSISVIRAIECAGNGRNFFQVSHGKKIAGTPWNLGGIGVAEWTGVPLREVLERAGVKRSARDVMPEGLDEKTIKRPIPIEKAMADDTLLVYAMNGHTLPPDHGFPMRMLVSGWVGIAHIKWVGRIEVSEQPLYSDYNTKKYILIGPEYEPNPPALGPMLTTQKVKSAFELPWNGEVPSGKRLLRGRSWSGEGRITKVEVSLDGGQTWQPARLREPNLDLAWVRWDVDWDARPRTYKLQARATDSKGNTQPDRIPLNEEGYSHWAVVTHSITVK